VFDVGFFELLLIGMVALLVLGPERLPHAARMAGAFLRKARISWLTLKAEVERELEAEAIRKSVRADGEALKKELGQSVVPADEGPEDGDGRR
jgi:sec-independent protein translocase protein TatB